MIKRILSSLLILFLLFGMVPATTVRAENRRNFITERSAVTGSDYTLSPALAATLNDIFDGNASIYAEKACATPVDTYLGTSPVRNNGVCMYVGPEGGKALERGTSCFIYANGVYYTLFGETTGNGEAGENSVKLDLSKTGSRLATYENFKTWGVRQGPGALVRASGHSFIVLDYDEEGLTYLDGNGDAQGLVAVNRETWDKVFFSYIYYIIQPKEHHYTALYATGKCGEDLFWAVDEAGTLTITGSGNIQYPAWNQHNDRIKKVVIRNGGIGIGNGAFYSCPALEEIQFEGAIPDLSESAFFGLNIHVRYPASAYGWDADFLGNYGGQVTWEPYGMTQLRIIEQTCTQSQDAISVSVAAEGDCLSYSWYIKDAGDEIFVKSSVSDATYSMKIGDQSGDRLVMCVITDRYGVRIQSDPVLLCPTQTLRTGSF